MHRLAVMNHTRAWIAGAAVVVAGCSANDGTEVPATATVVAAQETPATTSRGDTTVGPDLPTTTPVGATSVFVALGSCADQRGLVCVGGYWVHEVNSTAPAQLVASFDVSRLSPSAIAQTQGGGNELIFEGRYEPVDRTVRSLAFVATAAWRGLPDVTPTDGDLVVAVKKVDGALFASPVNSSTEIAIESVSVSGFAPPMVDTTWLASRVLEGGALVAGAIHGSTLDASQVFVTLPAVPGPCRDVIVHCEGDETPTYARDENLCLVPTGCVVRRACPEYRPVCGPGYVLATWAARPGGCDAFACDPTFLTQ
jgi:hypothetical protein